MFFAFLLGLSFVILLAFLQEVPNDNNDDRHDDQKDQTIRRSHFMV
jgi:hypothetical protein